MTLNDHRRATVNNFLLHLFLLVARIFRILCGLQGVEHDFFLAARAVSLGRCIFVLEATVPIQRHFRLLLLNDDLVSAEFNRLLLLLLILSWLIDEPQALMLLEQLLITTKRCLLFLDLHDRDSVPGLILLFGIANILVLLQVNHVSWLLLF